MGAWIGVLWVTRRVGVAGVAGGYAVRIPQVRALAQVR